MINGIIITLTISLVIIAVLIIQGSKSHPSDKEFKEWVERNGEKYPPNYTNRKKQKT